MSNKLYDAGAKALGLPTEAERIRQREEDRAAREIQLHNRLGYVTRFPGRIGSLYLNTLACVYLASSSDIGEGFVQAALEETVAAVARIEGHDLTAVLKVITDGVP